MNQPKILFLTFSLILFFGSGCKGPGEAKEKVVDVRVPVTVTGIQTETLSDYTELSANSAFLNKSVIQSPAGGYVDEIHVTPGETVKKNDLLFIIKTKEASAIRSDSTNPFSFSGLIKIKAAIDGIITSVNHPKGDYVMEGEPIVTIAVPSSFVFLMEVPFEMNATLQVGNACEILLSDGKLIQAKIKSKLPVISGNSQTQKYIIQPSVFENLPENLVAKIMITKRIIPEAIILPKSCILTDEVMKDFWVMKLISDSVAIKVTVKTGLSEGENVEIKEPHFTTSDRFLLTGNYGLGDTVKVIVVKPISK